MSSSAITSLQQPVAIIGMACRLPGADGLDEFWDLLASGRQAISRFPESRLDRRLYFDPRKGERGKTYSDLAGLIEDRPLDLALCGIDPAEADHWDPCHLNMCEVACRAMRDASFPQGVAQGQRGGVYIGHSGGSSLGGELVLGTLAGEVAQRLCDVPQFSNLPGSEQDAIVQELKAALRRDAPRRRADGGPALDANAAAHLISRALRVTGPSLAIEAACASSLVALLAAVEAVESGQVEFAVAGGASFAKADSLILFSHAQSCSSTGTRPFDDDADGLIGAEGYVAVVVKSLERALADGHRVHAVIRGIGMSADGRGRSLWAPRHEGQMLAMQRAYGASAAEKEVQYLEAHATSTQLGDATEIEAIARHFSASLENRRLLVGSVKSNIGHTLETAGLAGLIKTVLSMQRGIIPPSAGLRTPNRTIAWEKLPIDLPTQATPWPAPSTGQPRRAGVNAFGIGGLNVHVVVESHAAASPAANDQPTRRAGSVAPSVRTHARGEQPIAIVGRGLVLPGAMSPRDLTERIVNGRVAVGPPPAGRWADAQGVRSALHGPWHCTTNLGGYISGYEFDWRTHRVPPKQIAQANPLQFMLIDAARSALAEARCSELAFDRESTAVIVGTIFGGEFAHDLVIGLRWPLIQDRLRPLLSSRGWPPDAIEKVVTGFEAALLRAKPALNDETGSFTSSTLASRITKELRLSGGAFAVDAGECASLAAIDLACQLLRSGRISHAICAAAQRSMDLANYEVLTLQRRLLGSNSDNPKAGFVPGEGVVALVLKRLDDARRDGNPVFGLIHEVEASFHPAGTAKSPVGAVAPVTGCDAPIQSSQGGPGECGMLQDDELLPVIGHTLAAHGMATIVHRTTRDADRPSADGKHVQRVTIHAPTGLSYQVKLTTNGSVNQPSQETAGHTNVAAASTVTMRATTPGATLYRFAAPTMDGVVAQAAAVANADSQQCGEASRRQFSAADEVRCAIIAVNSAELAKKASLYSAAGSQSQAADALSSQGIFVARPLRSPRIAFLFPGQGSQYLGMSLEIAKISNAARCALDECDTALVELGGHRFAELVGGTNLRDDAWTIQASMLAANVATAAWLGEMGLQPDVVAGHSYGEFAALVASGAMSAAEALGITSARTESLQKWSKDSGGLASLRAPRAVVDELLREFGSPLYVTHINSPDQTVVGGRRDVLASFCEFAAARGITAFEIPVPFPFHTPLLAPSQLEFGRALQHAAVAPPRIPFLSAIGNRYVADPQEIRSGLVEQLVTPVDYVGLIERLVAEGCNVLVEAGPQQTLTRFHKEILVGRAVALLTADVRGRDPAFHRLHLQAQGECLGLLASGPSTTSKVKTVPTQGEGAPAHFDATAHRRGQMRQRASVPPPAAGSQQLLAPPPHYDGTLKRREINRTASAAPASLNGAGDAATTWEGGRAQGKTTGALVPAVAATGPSQLEQFLIDFIVDQTGYPAEIIDLDWDMEADLGIDSIKKAQLFGELRELFDIENSLSADARSRFALDQFRTLRNVLDLLAQSGGKHEWLVDSPTAASDFESPSPTLISSSHSEVRMAAATPRDIAAIPSPTSDSVLEQFLIDYVVEQTGYPPEIIDLDAEFEADLGIDSIKKAQLFGELREYFALQIDASDRLALSDFATLRHVMDFLKHATVAQASIDRRQEPLALAAPVQELATRRRQSSEADLASGAGPLESDVGDLPLSAAESRGAAFEAARALGHRCAQQIAKQITDLVDGAAPEHSPRSARREWEALGQYDRQVLNGLAAGAEVPLACLAAYHSVSRQSPLFEPLPWLGIDKGDPRLDSVADASPDEAQENAALANVSEPTTAGRVTTRRVLRLRPAPHLPNTPTIPELSGPALIVGRGEIADELASRIASLGQTACVLDEQGDLEVALARFEDLWKQAPMPHLFLLTGRESTSRIGLEYSRWQARRLRGLDLPYWLCQHWVARMVEAGLMDEGSLVAVTSLGGDFGLSGRIEALEGGALAGLLKAIVIENWTNGYRTLPVKVIDCPGDEPAAAIVDAVLSELAAPSYDMEVAWAGGQRHVIRAEEMPIESPSSRPIQTGGNWIFTGGARGITAHVAERLSARFGLRAALIGCSPYPHVSLRWRQLRQDDPRQLKIEIMAAAREAGENPIKAWERAEKALEIDATLRRFREAGIDVRYYSCDVSDRDALERTLQEVRRASGPIHGVIHGAGVGKDARFEHKEPRRVQQCFDAKVTGALALIELTANDPIEHFAAFGSISGRFGANGHTDYSSANDMLAKVVDAYRTQRPEVAAVTFHWHAWGDIGMAAKPETRLALEMINMQFMPAQEGIDHLMAELQAGAPEGEILITDDRYYRLFYPSETLAATQGRGAASPDDGPARFPLLDRGSTVRAPDRRERSTLSLDPVQDPFLAQHRLNDRPLLPIVVGLELLAEAGARSLGSDVVSWLTDVRAVNGLKFPTDSAQQVDVATERMTNGVHCVLSADLRTRTGALVEARRVYLTGTVHCEQNGALSQRGLSARPPRSGWQSVVYPAKGSPFYLGPALQCLRKIHVGDGESWGRLAAPAAVELTGPLRPVDGWIVPSAAIDACLFATGILAWFTIEPGTALPESIASLTLGRPPRAGESCLVHTRLNRREQGRACFDFTLYGVNGDVLVDVADYRIVWLPSN